jgi:hypothetical protein
LAVHAICTRPTFTVLIPLKIWAKVGFLVRKSGKSESPKEKLTVRS